MKVGDKITKELRESVVKAWTEAEEIASSFDELSKEEIIDCLNAIKNRALEIQGLLGPHITDEDLDEICPL